MLVVIASASKVLAADNPDELYKQGRFAEAEKEYARLDMDHPKDIRYRYNRGCAVYQSSDYQSARAAFSSALRRATDDALRFKAAYNLGNIAYKLRDFESAAANYKQAIRYNPSSEDARYNLELALRSLEREKTQSREEQESENQQDSGESQGAQRKGKEDGFGSSEGKKGQHESPRDLSGALEALQVPSAEQNEEQTQGSSKSTIDEKMAEALLDNIQEDRSRFLLFQVPNEKRHGVQSGKDW
jgi:Ca-activated chloride channel family protein